MSSSFSLFDFFVGETGSFVQFPFSYSAHSWLHPPGDAPRTLCFHVSCMWSIDLLSCLARILYRWYYALHLISSGYMIATVSCCGVKIDKQDIKLEDDGSEERISLLNKTKMFRVFCYRLTINNQPILTSFYSVRSIKKQIAGIGTIFVII